MMRKLLTGIEGRVDKFIESKNVRDVELAKIRRDTINDIMYEAKDACVGTASAIKGVGRLMMRRDVQRTIGVLGTSISIGLIICSYDNK